MAVIARGQITISEIYDGDPGADAVVYQLEVSPDQINKSADGVLSSSTITVKGYKRVGNSTRSAYSCRFKIYENSTLKYTSSANESSKTYTISSTSIKSLKVEMYVAGGTSSLLEERTVLIIKDGAKGDTGLKGALLRSTGLWESQVSYVNNDSFVDAVLYNGESYMCLSSHVSGEEFDLSKWESSNKLVFLATQALLADKGSIDVLGAGELFVGNLLKTEGWSMTNGAIRHTKTGLTLASDGKIYSPNGSAIIIGEAPLDIYSQEQADISNPTISGTHNVSTWRWTGEAPFSELKDGQQITFWNPRAISTSVPNVTGDTYANNGSGIQLKLQFPDGADTGWVNCYYGGTSRLTSHYGSGQAVKLTYRKSISINGSTTLYTGWWCDANYNSDTVDRLKWVTPIKAKIAIVAANLIVGDESGYFHLKTGAAFNINKGIFYAGSSIALNATGTNNYAAYNFTITTTQALNMNLSSEIYIKGVYDNNIFTPISTTPLVNKPTEADGYDYFYLGVSSATPTSTGGTTTRVMYLSPTHEIFRWDDGTFKSLNQIILDTQIVAQYAQETANNIGDGTNLLVVANITRGKYLTSTGAEFTNASWFYSDYIDFLSAETLTVSGYTNLGNAPSVAYYDENKVLLGALTNNNQSLGKSIKISAFPGTRYVRVSGEINDLSTYKVERGKVASVFSRAPEDVALETSKSLSQLDDIASDSKLTPSEKLQVNVEWTAIQKEKVTLNAQATALNITTANTNYNTYYTYLSNYITALLANMTTTSDVVRSTFNSHFSNYYTYRATLQTAITNANKTLANNAQTTADTANTNASTALSNSINVRTGINLLSKAGDFKSVVDFERWVTRGFWSRTDTTSSYSIVENRLRFDYSSTTTVNHRHHLRFNEPLKSGGKYAMSIRYKSDGPLWLEGTIIGWSNYWGGVTLPSSDGELAIVNKTFTYTGGDVDYGVLFIRREAGHSATTYIEIESIILVEGEVIPAIWNKSLKDQQEDIDNAAGGVNLWNTVDCTVLSVGDGINSIAWNETGFSFKSNTVSGATSYVARLKSAINRNGFYTVSFKAKVNTGTAVEFRCDISDIEVYTFSASTSVKTFTFTTQVTNYSSTYNFVDFRLVSSNITLTITDLMIEYGTIAHPFTYAPRQLPVSIEQKTNALIATADLMTFQNQSGVAFASMFNDPNSGTPTLKAANIDADSLKVSAVQYKFTDMNSTNILNKPISVVPSTPVNIKVNRCVVVLPILSSFIGKILTLYNDEVSYAGPSATLPYAPTIVTCAQGILGALHDSIDDAVTSLIVAGLEDSYEYVPINSSRRNTLKTKGLMKGYSSDTGTPPANDPVYWSRFEGDICFPCTKDKMVTEMSFYNGALQLLAVPHPTSTILCQWKVLNNKSYRTLNDTFFKENIIISGDTSHGFLYNQSLKVVTSERTGAEATDATKSFVFTKFKQGQDYAYGIDSGGTTWGEFYPIYVPPTCKTLKILGTPVSAVSPLASYLDLILPYYFEIGRTMEIDLTNCYVTSGTYNGYPTGGVIRLCSTCYGGTETKANAQAGLISTSSKYDFCPIIVETLSGSNSTQDIYYQLFAGQKYAITRIAANRWFVQEF